MALVAANMYASTLPHRFLLSALTSTHPSQNEGWRYQYALGAAAIGAVVIIGVIAFLMQATVSLKCYALAVFILLLGLSVKVHTYYEAIGSQHSTRSQLETLVLLLCSLHILPNVRRGSWIGRWRGLCTY